VVECLVQIPELIEGCHNRSHWPDLIRPRFVLAVLPDRSRLDDPVLSLSGPWIFFGEIPGPDPTADQLGTTDPLTLISAACWILAECPLHHLERSIHTDEKRITGQQLLGLCNPPHVVPVHATIVVDGLGLRVSLHQFPECNIQPPVSSAGLKIEQTAVVQSPPNCPRQKAHVPVNVQGIGLQGLAPVVGQQEIL
jgi:hypothetical protein